MYFICYKSYEYDIELIIKIVLTYVNITCDDNLMKV